MINVKNYSYDRRYVRVVYERGFMDFFERFLIAVNVSQLLIVSPWVTSLENETIKLTDIANKINRENIKTLVFLRNPKKEPINSEAIRILSECPTVDIHFNDELHAKVYVCKCDPFGFALVGSANLSGRATRALEVGLMIDGIGRGQEIVAELQKLGSYDLLGRAGTYDGSLKL